MKQERVLENTFAPACENRELSVSDIIAGLGFGAFKYRTLPPDVRKAVDEEMKRRARTRVRRPSADEAKSRAEMLDAARDLVERRTSGSPGAVRMTVDEKDVEAGRIKLHASDMNAPLAHAGKSTP